MIGNGVDQMIERSGRAESPRDDPERIRGRDRTGARRLPIGAELVPTGGVEFRVWAPRQRTMEVVLLSGPAVPVTAALSPEEEGCFAGVVPGAAEGTRYAFRLGGKHGPLLPDPASRYQPEDLLGPSQVVDPSAMRWNDSDWKGVATTEGQVLYELHAGTFTPEGTWAAACEHLPYLAELGVTALEVMPVGQFRGRYGWGYDGVLLFAPFQEYGTPDDFRRFVDLAHASGLAVILDVVYNHLGAGGDLMKAYSDDFFSDRHKTEWGVAPNFDGPGCAAVRSFILANVAYWVDEFHLDGMRIDATQCLFDTSRGSYPESDRTSVARVGRGSAGAGRRRERDPARPIAPRPGGWGPGSRHALER